MATIFFDKQGLPIETEEEVQNLLRSTEYRRIGMDEGAPGSYVSTQWTGLDLGRPGRVPPRIFETRVLDTDGSSTFLERYASEEEARAGHQRHVRELRAMFESDDA